MAPINVDYFFVPRRKGRVNKFGYNRAGVRVVNGSHKFKYNRASKYGTHPLPPPIPPTRYINFFNDCGKSFFVKVN